MSGDDFMDLEVYAAGDIGDVTDLPGDQPGLRIHLPGSRILIDLLFDDQDRIIQERFASPGHEITRTFNYP